MTFDDPRSVEVIDLFENCNRLDRNPEDASRSRRGIVG